MKNIKTKKTVDKTFILMMFVLMIASLFWVGVGIKLEGIASVILISIALVYVVTYIVGITVELFFPGYLCGSEP